MSHASNKRPASERNGTDDGGCVVVFYDGEDGPRRSGMFFRDDYKDEAELLAFSDLVFAGPSEYVVYPSTKGLTDDDQELLAEAMFALLNRFMDTDGSWCAPKNSEVERANAYCASKAGLVRFKIWPDDSRCSDAERDAILAAAKAYMNDNK